VIFSSHLLEQVQEVADRVAIFSLGRKVLEGSLDDLLVEKESTLINLPGELDEERREQLQRVLTQAGFSGADVSFSRPRLSLEQLYLRTVKADRTSSSRGTRSPRRCGRRCSPCCSSSAWS
jgi:ABC-type multidrug transport system ATPase subunit